MNTKTIYNIIYTMTNLFINSYFSNNENKRNVIKTRSILLLIKNENLNGNFKLFGLNTCNPFR